MNFEASLGNVDALHKSILSSLQFPGTITCYYVNIQILATSSPSQSAWLVKSNFASWPATLGKDMIANDRELEPCHARVTHEFIKALSDFVILQKRMK